MECVTGVVRKDGAVEKVGLEMDVMVVLEELTSINVYFTQVCILDCQVLHVWILF